MKATVVLSSFCAFILLAGCAVSASTNQTCTTQYNLNVSPAAGTADHAQAAPANQVRFGATITASAPAGCAAPALAIVATPTWTSADTKDIQIDSSSNSPTNGLATCLASTNGPVTLTATTSFDGVSLTQTASLTCK